MKHKIYYPDLGLINTSDMFRQAMAQGYAVPAYKYKNEKVLGSANRV